MISRSEAHRGEQRTAKNSAAKNPQLIELPAGGGSAPALRESNKEGRKALAGMKVIPRLDVPCGIGIADAKTDVVRVRQSTAYDGKR